MKNNIPTRIAFMVSSQVDSRTIIDSAGAEKLLGRGDMLYLGNGKSQPVRLQGTYINDDKIDEIVDFAQEPRPDLIVLMAVVRVEIFGEDLQISPCFPQVPFILGCWGRYNVMDDQECSNER